MPRILQAVLRGTIDVLLPPRCAGCGSLLAEAADAFCPVCSDLFEPAVGGFCLRCRCPVDKDAFLCPACRAFGPLQDLRACFQFGGPLGEGVWQLKRRGTLETAGFFADCLAQSFRRAEWPAAVLVPVPLHRRRFAARGFNQATLLARALAYRLKLPSDGRLLERTTWLRPQVATASRAERRLAATGAFRARRKMPCRPICLVDDVVTTGATLFSCAQALHGAGAERVFALCVAQTPPEN